MPSRRLLRIFGWAVGAPLAIFRFLRRDIEIVDLEASAPPAPLPGHEPAGVGPVVHRLYRATIRQPKLGAASLLKVIAADLNVIAPSEVLRFERTRGEPGRLEEGDELLIRMAGPWDAPVKVTQRREDSLRLGATRGHPQLGQLELRLRPDGPHIVMEIQTRERAAGVAFHALRRIGLIRRMQTYTWAEMLENASQLAGGRRPDQVTVTSWREEPPPAVPARAPRVAARHTN